MRVQLGGLCCLVFRLVFGLVFRLVFHLVFGPFTLHPLPTRGLRCVFGGIYLSQLDDRESRPGSFCGVLYFVSAFALWSDLVVGLVFRLVFDRGSSQINYQTETAPTVDSSPL